jgi:DNA-binding NarL/FixJ family response regulator
MGGVRAADLIRGERPETKVLFVSGYSEEALFREGVEEGVNFLNKPFSPNDLDQKVRAVLDGAENSAKV